MCVIDPDEEVDRVSFCIDLGIGGQTEVCVSVEDVLELLSAGK